MTSVRAAIASYLERRYEETHVLPAAGARLMAAAWGAMSARAVARPLDLPSAGRVIGVGGASLGGSCKTPFAIALADGLAARGLPVALIGHAYRARPRFPRVVRADDDVAEVGDDALYAARQLARSRAVVVVGPTRQAAVDFAAQCATWLVVDGLLQTRPARLARSFLLLDGERAWGNGRCPPAGDLRAPRSALLEAADAVAVVHDAIGAPPVPDAALPRQRTFFAPDVVSRLDRAIWPDGSAISVSRLRSARLGLITTIARSDRVVGGLARRGLDLVTRLSFADHHRPSRSELERGAAEGPLRVDVWLTTAKCATKLPRTVAGSPVLVLEHEVRLTDRLVAWALSDADSVDALFQSGGGVG
jgi:tetraacyldisaccharide 4'-kinase